MRIASARIPCANRVGLVGLRRTVRTTGTRISTCLTGGLRMPAMLGSTFMEVVTYSITHCRITLNGTHIDRHSRGHCSLTIGGLGTIGGNRVNVNTTATRARTLTDVGLTRVASNHPDMFNGDRC